MRFARVDKSVLDLKRIEPYLPENYRVGGSWYQDGGWIVHGEDVEGSTLEDVIRRLASVGMPAREVWPYEVDVGDEETGPWIESWFDDEPPLKGSTDDSMAEDPDKWSKPPYDTMTPYELATYGPPEEVLKERIESYARGPENVWFPQPRRSVVEKRPGRAKGRFLGLEQPGPNEPWTIHISPKPAEPSEDKDEEPDAEEGESR
jgi:hypothetical protein